MQPKETRLLSEAGGLFQPDTVAKIILKDSLVRSVNVNNRNIESRPVDIN